MPDSLAKQLRSDMECEGLLECFHGLKPLDRACFQALVEHDEPLTIDEIGEAVDRERSTVYRAVQRLLQRDIVTKQQVNYEQGGYCHVYHPADPTDIARTMHRLLNDWYAKMDELIREFEETYDDVPTVESATASN